MTSTTIRPRTTTIALLGGLALLGLTARPVVAQPPFGGAGGYRGPNVDEIVARLDRDQDGRVEPGEIDGSFRPLMESLAREHRLDLSDPISNGRIRDLLRAKFGSGTLGGIGGLGSGVTGMTVPGLLGFGTAADGSPLPVLGFGPPDADSWTVLKQKYDARTVDRVDESMFRYDRDKDNLLDRDEVRRADWSGNPYEFDRNLDGKLSRSEIAERYKARYSKSDSRNDNSNAGSRPGGSGSPNNGLNSNSSSGTSNGSNNSSGSSSGNASSSDADRVARYAEGLLKQYDANGDGRLQKSEWSGMRGEPKKADRDNDDVITRDELTRHLADYGRSRSDSSGSKTAASPEDRKSYRFASPTERLPSGLPEWFAEKDADRDGQVQMSEYATTWNDARAKEFADWDLNGDGTVTPAECLKRQAETESTSGKEDERRDFGSRRY